MSQFYHLFADIAVIVHFLWILFMLAGFATTLLAFRWRALFDWFYWRTIHLGGILFVATLGLLGKPCPLTVWEIAFRRQAAADSVYEGSFIAHHLEKVIYYDVAEWIITVPTTVLALLTLVIWVWRPPARVARLLRQS